MISRLLSALLPAALVLAGCLVCLSGCEMSNESTEIPNEVVGRAILVGGGPAANADIQLIPVGHLPGEAGGDTLGLVFLTRADGRGEYAFRDVPRGRYNVIASRDTLRSFRDSVAMTGRGQELPQDTLRAAGSLRGRVRLQPQHDPRTATVQVLGTTVFVNVERDGRFVLQGLGAGRYRLRIVTTEDGYSPLFADVSMRAGQADSLAEPLTPFYSDIPVITDLEARSDSAGGTIHLAWGNPDYDRVLSYLIYRDSAGSLLPSEIPIARVSKRSYIDTIYSVRPRAGQHLFTDTAAHRYEYRIKILAQSGVIGPSFGILPVTAYPPIKAAATGQWKHIAAAAFPARANASLVAMQDKLWLLGGQDRQGGRKDIWASPDGEAWTQLGGALPFQDSVHGDFRAAALRDSLWALVFNRLPVPWGDSGIHAVHNKLELWASGDGLAWTRVSDSVPIPYVSDFSFAAAGGRLWILGASDSQAPRHTYGSEDGRAWMKVAETAGLLQGLVSLTAGTDSLYALDTAGTLWTLVADSAGAPWRQAAGDLPFYHAGVSTLQAHDGGLWVLGGYLEAESADQVWVSQQGGDWSLNSIHAPFGERLGIATVSFRGRLFVAGGYRGAENRWLGDVWSLPRP